MPAISILLPVFNARRHLPAALESLRRQTFGDFELIAVDDGSTDRSGDLLDRWAARDARLRVIRRPNSGIVAALNAAIAAARAPLLARMDADDIAHPDRLARQAAFLAAHPAVLACGTGIYVMDDSGATVERRPRPAGAAEIERALLRGDGSALVHPTVVFRAEAVRAAGGYRAEAQFTEDLDLFLRLAERGPLANLPELLLRYRVHFRSTNFTRSADKARVKSLVLREACARRGLPFDAAAVDLSYFRRSRADFHRDWAVKALAFPSAATPLRHALLACAAAPGQRQSWRTLRYVLRRLAGGRSAPRSATRALRGARIEFIPPIQVGPCRPVFRNGGRILLDEGVQFAGESRPVRLSTGPQGLIAIGAGTRLGPGVALSALRRISIGPDCVLGEAAVVVDHVAAAAPAAPGRGSPVCIGARVHIGPRARILAGVTIGEGAVVGPGAIVARNLAAGASVDGDPAATALSPGSPSPAAAPAAA